jgi:hypothetical protein
MNSNSAAAATPVDFAKAGAEGAEKVADLFKVSSSAALSGVQDYNNKVLEFARTNTNATFDFFQKLQTVKSPSEFMALSTEHARTQTQVLTEQTKQLLELAQKVTAAAGAPMKFGAGNMFNTAG